MCNEKRHLNLSGKQSLCIVATLRFDRWRMMLLRSRYGEKIKGNNEDRNINIP